MITIAITNQKGGCGKTTTAVNLSAAFAMLGYRVLAVDLDAQAHTTLGFGIEPDKQNKTICDVLNNTRTPIQDIITGTYIDKLFVAPSNILLSGVELELASQQGREYVLKEQLSSVGDDFDICIIDCSPSLDLLTLNALVGCTDVVIPVQTHYYAIEGLKQLLGTIQIVCQRFNSDLNILGIVLTFVERRAILSIHIERQMREYFGALVFNSIIHKTIRLAEAPSAGEAIVTYAPDSNASDEHFSLAQEIIDRKNQPITCYEQQRDWVIEYKELIRQAKNSAHRPVEANSVASECTNNGNQSIVETGNDQE